MHWTEDVLRFGDTDANGHINNTVFSVLCEGGRVALFNRHLTPLLAPGTLYVIVRLTVDFRAELHYPGVVRTATWIEAIGRSSIRLRHRVESEGRLAAEAESICVLMDSTTRRSIPLEGATRAAAEALARPGDGR